MVAAMGTWGVCDSTSLRIAVSTMRTGCDSCNSNTSTDVLSRYQIEVFPDVLFMSGNTDYQLMSTERQITYMSSEQINRP